MSYLIQALSLLLNLAFNAAAILFVLRVAAEASRADFRNPLSQLIYRYSNPIVTPIRRIIPNWRYINVAALLILWLLMLFKRTILFFLIGIHPNFLGLLLLSLADLLDFFAVFYMTIIIVWSLLSLVASDNYHPAYQLIVSLATPLLRPLRGRLIAGVLDFRPWAILIILMLSRLLIVNPLSDWGIRLMAG